MFGKYYNDIIIVVVNCRGTYYTICVQNINKTVALGGFDRTN